MGTPKMVRKGMVHLPPHEEKRLRDVIVRCMRECTSLRGDSRRGPEGKSATTRCVPAVIKEGPPTSIKIVLVKSRLD
jgi:hypothetical protein